MCWVGLGGVGVGASLGARVVQVGVASDGGAVGPIFAAAGPSFLAVGAAVSWEPSLRGGLGGERGDCDEVRWRRRWVLMLRVLSGWLLLGWALAWWWWLLFALVLRWLW